MIESATGKTIVSVTTATAGDQTYYVVKYKGGTTKVEWAKTGTIQKFLEQQS